MIKLDLILHELSVKINEVKNLTNGGIPNARIGKRNA